MKKGWLVFGSLIIIAGGLVAFGLSSGKNVATSDAGSISEQKLYDSLKKTSEGKQTFANLMIKQVLQKNYGNKVDQKDIDQQFSDAKKQYGASFESTLQSSGMTPDSYKDNLYLSALEKAAYQANQKFTNKELQKAYDAYTPNVSASIIKTASEEDAKNVISDIKGGTDFAKEAKDKSTDTASKDKGGKLDKFDSTVSSSVVNSAVRDAAFKLKAGEMSESPIKVAADGTTSTSDSYYVIKLNSKDKKASFAKLKEKMKGIIVDEKLNADSTAMQTFIGQQLNKANVHITDSDLKNALSTYTEAASKK
ncbi:peptidylprolyl isomerase [Weissella coleopterorum]|uniref:Foldase protein PrsA n=1 Tax=Weissella coleopterorum TaxID=2714949 RepID=A0A6G8B0R6_9LACO|nr:peptidylprolyl isomerase [Weissella coleopterorum]QIL50846.1 peptidylprolyl isomerase [Weissella coleopterorum]